MIKPLTPKPLAPKPVAPKPSARAVALELLQGVLVHQRTLDELIERNAGWPQLETRDRGFARLLTSTTLRRLGEINQALDLFIKERPPGKARAVADALRLGACQILFLGTQAHAAVGETVELIGSLDGLAGYKGLANAVLRRMAREKPATDPWRNLPAWLKESWVDAYGEPKARAIAAAHLAEAPLDLSLKADADDWAQKLGGGILPTGTLRLPAGSGPVETLSGYAEGGWWVQDAAAALPARLLGQPRQAIDLCAAPGGKTAELLARGIEVTAVDRSAQRLMRLKQNLERLKLSATVIEADATTWRPGEPAEAVLLDAPCSATGTIRRHPDLPWLKRPTDLPKLTALQDRLLANAVAMTRPGGMIVYATCSLQPEEGVARIEALLASGAPVERAPIAASELGGLGDLLTPEGDMRSLPFHLADKGGMDGFFAARLRRR
jgi:16S rRNA (cytosine967-C5)-methyltransferase